MVEEAIDSKTGELTALAAQWGVSLPHLSLVKAGKRRPDGPLAKRLADYLVSRGLISKRESVAVQLELRNMPLVRTTEPTP